MIKNDLNISNLENYTFSKYSGEIHGIERFNSYSNKPILNYNQEYLKNNYNIDKYSNNEIINEKQNTHLNNNIKDINYNQLNITHYDKSPVKKNYNNINNINNINIISQNEYNHNTNYNQINKINTNRNKKKSFSKERKFDRRKFRTPDKNLNYNKFNFINSNNSENRIHLDNIKNKDKNMSSIINYNENILDKYNKKSKKRSLTSDNNFNRTNHKNKSIIINPIGYNKNININNINIISQDSNLYNLQPENNGSLSQYNYNNSNNENNIKTYNFSSSMKQNQKFDINNIHKFTEKILNSNNIDSIENKENEYYKYQESCFNNRLPRGAKVPLLSHVVKNLAQSVIYNNKTPSPTRKNKNYLGSEMNNSKNKKYSKYKRSVSSEPDLKKINNKLKHKYFKLKLFNKDYSPSNSFSNKSKENSNVNSCINNKYNKMFNNVNTSCGNYNSSLYNNDKSSCHSNERNYNLTQPDFSKSLYNWNLSNGNNINKLLNKEENNSFKNLNNNPNSKDLYYKYLKYDSQNYNYQSYIESYNSTWKENQTTNNNSKTKKGIKSKKYNFEKYLNINNYTTKLSTNNNTFDENSNNTFSLYNKETKNNNKNVGTSTIEEVHLNFVNILQNTKNMMEKQENNIKDKVLYNNVNSTIVILEEREIE